MVDPLLGLSYDVRKTHFETLPPSIRELCRQAGKAERWIYASYSLDTAIYLVVAGLVKIDDGNQSSNLWEPGSGVVLEMSASQKKCRAIGAPDVVFFKEGGNIADPVLEGLARDAVSRYVKAFGGEEKLKRRMAEQKIKPGLLAPPVSKAFAQLK